MRILALHVDATFVDAAVLDAATTQLVSPVARIPFTLQRPNPEAVEVYSDELWSALTSASRQACRDFPEVQGIGLAVATPILVLLDNADLPLRPLWLPS